MTDDASGPLDLDSHIDVSLWAPDVVVLFHWLMELDFDQLPVNHKAEKQALNDLLAQLDEWALGTTERDLERAREIVARNMGWE
ncbi:hypothetical protein [Streptomyces nigra]|uniref:hypothetical protein n=1 Tax=Streptomyces nigra TaxID=1827580 RepID=UPI000D527273|nr:hypothetical protein [Streptomyces nigra]AWE51839.1 hypothetical protein DC008_20500 [Streptomyces nigra]